MIARHRGIVGVALLGALLGPSAAAAATGRIDVAVAIDFGSGGPHSVATCVSVPEGSSGSAALAQVRLPRATYSGSSGLLCSIAGWPNATDCGRRDGAGYHYWSYFHGSSTGWTYASNGPAANRASEASAEGWRFQDAGTGRPGDPAPRLSASDRSACAKLHQASATTTTPMPVTIPGVAVATTTSSPQQPRVTTTTSRATALPSHGSAATVPASSSAPVHEQRGSAQWPWGSVVAALALVVGATALWRYRRGTR